MSLIRTARLAGLLGLVCAGATIAATPDEGRRAPAARLADHPSPAVRALAEKLRKGLPLSGPERRAWARLESALSGDPAGIPDDWRTLALARTAGLERPQASWNWSFLGPSGVTFGPDLVSGRTTAIAVHPANKSIIWLGTAAAGVWKSVDAGATWLPLFNNGESLAIGAIALDPANPQVVWVATGEGNFSGGEIYGDGVYRSIDGGTTWTRFALPFLYAAPDRNLRGIFVDPRDSAKVYVAGDGGLYWTADNGANWNRTSFGLTGSGLLGTSLFVDGVTPAPGQPSWLYVALGTPFSAAATNGIYRSKSGPGGPWTLISGAGSGFATSDIARINLVSAPSDRRIAYALVSRASNFQFNGIYRTADISATTVAWTLQSTSNFCAGQCAYNMAGLVEAGDPARLFLGGLEVNHSRNSGGTSAAKSNYTGTGTNYVHADVHAFAMPDATTIYVATDGGFFRGTISGTTNISVSWENRNAQLPLHQFYRFSAHPTDGAQLMGGTQDNGLPLQNGGGWSLAWTGDGVNAVWDYGNPAFGYVSHAYATVQRNNTLLTSPTSWTCIRNFGGCTTCSLGCSPDGGRTQPLAPVVLDANDPNTMYAVSHRVYRNSAVRTGSTWSAISPDLTGGGYLTAIHSAKANGQAGRLWTGSSDGKVFRTVDGGANWLDRSSGLPPAWIEEIITDPANADRALVAFNGFGIGHVFRTVDGGLTWTDLSAALPDMPYYALALTPGNVNECWLGGEMGLFRAGDVWGAGTWQSANGALPPLKVTDLLFSPAGALRAATYGRGIWQLDSFTAGSPGEAGVANSLRVGKGSGTILTLAWTPACNASGHTFYAGDLDTLRSGGVAWSNRQCGLPAAGSTALTPPAGNLYFVITGQDGTTEGSYGQSSGGAELPPAPAGACTYAHLPSASCS